MNPEAKLRNAVAAANDDFFTVAMRAGVTRGEVELARARRDRRTTRAHADYRDRFRF